ncbi:MAG: hypothetical protein M0R74_19660, partial [Dehalococcoidia bacterium]|nr:hypothetical protein [Dehalococcoidia bacterium]
IVLFSLTGEPLSVHREVATDLLRLPGDIEAPDGLLPVLARALSRDPADRYPGAGALAADLLPALEVQALAPSAPQAAASIEKQERARPPRRSLAGGLRAAGAGLAAIGLLGLSALMLGSDADDGQDRGPVSTSTSASDERTGALTDARHHVAGERTAGVAPAMSAEACANEAWQHFVANGEAPLFRDENACRVALNGTSCPAPPVLEGDALRFTDSTHIAVGWHAACGATAHWIEVAGPTGLLAQRQAVEGDTEMLVEIGSDQPSEVLVTVTAFYDDPNLEWSHSRLLAR